MTNRTIARLYDSYDDAAKTVRDLEAAKVPHDDVSLIANNVDERHGPHSSKGNESIPGAEAGVGFGAVIGGGAGLLAGLGMLAIPGIGPVVAAGWLVAALAGAGAGAMAGGLLGGLVGAGIPKEHAEVFAEGVRRGGTLVTARVPDERVLEIEGIMDRNSSVDIVSRRALFTSSGWAGFDDKAPAYPRDELERNRTTHRAA